jgi:ubiquinone/menaquinone biosynthesis C-methylase UbiE
VLFCGLVANPQILNIMSNENKSIHDFDINLICEYFSYLERQGPGSPEITLKALSFIHNLTEHSKIADLGCGTGGQTMVLAQNVRGTITGLDLFPRFINLFNQNAQKLNLQDKVTGVVGSMDDLPFQQESLDLIWSEGAIYNIGFENGLKTWKPFLKKGGYVAVSEASWFTPDRPEEINEFWKDAYPGMDTIPNKIAQMQDAGYIPVASFIIPDDCWIDHFYKPQTEADKIFLEKHAGNKTAEDFILPTKNMKQNFTISTKSSTAMHFISGRRSEGRKTWMAFKVQ